MEVSIPVSVGELVDKLSILEIKSANIEDEAKRKNVVHEENLLRELFQSKAPSRELVEKKAELKAINLDLWHVEDQLRTFERSNYFGGEFIKLARAVYQLNDKRAEIKREINNLSGSSIVEEKSYAKY
jgi:hypothetical protein